MSKLIVNLHHTNNTQIHYFTNLDCILILIYPMMYGQWNALFISSLILVFNLDQVWQAHSRSYFSLSVIENFKGKYCTLMGKHTKKKGSHIPIQRGHPGCMWSIILHVIQYHHWHNVTKGLPHRRHGGNKHTKSKATYHLFWNFFLPQSFPPDVVISRFFVCSANTRLWPSLGLMYFYSN